VIVFIEEKPHPVFTREGDDLILEKSVSYALAVLGGTIEVPTIKGKARLKIPARSRSGKILRMRNEGLPHLNGFGRGDLLVELSIFIPEKVGSAEKGLLAELDRNDRFRPDDQDPA
jgi:molecular chaperone DnaJ